MGLNGVDESPTSCTGANTPEGTSATPAVLLVWVCVAELLGVGTVFQPDLHVWQVPPVRARGQGDVPHAGGHQSAHVLENGEGERS